jgi:hypothetical protein
MLAVHVDDAERAAAFVEIVDVLGDEGDGAAGHALRPFALKPPSATCAALGALVWIAAAHVVEAQHEVRIAGEAFGVATSSTRCCSHRPPAERKVSIPLSAETPAPVRMTMLRYGLHRGHEARRTSR